MNGVLPIRSRIAAATVAAALVLLVPIAAYAVVGDLLDTVGVPSGLVNSNNCSVAAAFDGTYFYTMQGGLDVDCAGSTLQVFDPPAPDGVPGAPPDDATLVATKTIQDAGGNPVSISAVEWDASRSTPGNVMFWGAYADTVYLIDIGDPAAGGVAVATFQFNPGVGGATLVDGLAWDPADDTLYYSPDVDCNVYQFGLGTGGQALGGLLNTVTPKNLAGESDCSVSGVAIGAGNTLYIGRDGTAEIRRVDKTTGAFVSTFATTAGRVEDLVCDPVTYAPLEAILAKDAYGGPLGDPDNHAFYEAFEVEAGTCPLPQPEITLDPPDDMNEAGTDHTVTATVKLGDRPVPDLLVSFAVTVGPNIGEVSDPGECFVNAGCTTDANGQVSWTYTGSGGPGIDTIVACFTDEAGEEHCAEVSKTWVDTTAPVAACTESVNPAGNVPQAPGKGQNEDGFYHLAATDSVDPNPQIFVTDTLGSGPFGPFFTSTTVKLTQDSEAVASSQPMGGPNSAVTAHIILPGEPQIYAVDASGNISDPITCFVPPPPK
ncbi:MAG TPA: hypothetical protein VJK02_02370 [Anaerolineales bacterium]|nr:hypothetical protein [Anaerolineales bacterium]